MLRIIDPRLFNVVSSSFWIKVTAFDSCFVLSSYGNVVKMFENYCFNHQLICVCKSSIFSWEILQKKSKPLLKMIFLWNYVWSWKFVRLSGNYASNLKATFLPFYDAFSRESELLVRCGGKKLYGGCMFQWVSRTCFSCLLFWYWTFTHWTIIGYPCLTITFHYIRPPWVNWPSCHCFNDLNNIIGQSI